MTNQTSSLFNAQNLWLRVRGRTLFAALNLSVEARTLLGFSGPSGCGKSTLLRALARLIDPHKGTIRLRAESAEDIGVPAYRRRVLLVGQQPALIEGTVEENLSRPFTYRCADRTFQRASARELLDTLGLAESVLDKTATDLSVGEQQRVCLVRALLVGPDVLLLDEPTSALDEENRRAAEELVHAHVRDNDAAAIITSHDLPELDRWCDRVVDLRDYIPEDAAV